MFEKKNCLWIYRHLCLSWWWYNIVEEAESILDESILDESILDESILDESILDESILDESILDENNLDDLTPLT